MTTLRTALPRWKILLQKSQEHPLTLTQAENDIHATVYSLQSTYTHATNEMNNLLDTYKHHTTPQDTQTNENVDNNTKHIQQLQETIASINNRLEDVHTNALTTITTQISSTTHEMKKQHQQLRKEINARIQDL